MGDGDIGVIRLPVQVSESLSIKKARDDENVRTYRPVVPEGRNNASALPELNFSILEQSCDRACSRTENVEPREMYESSRPGTLHQRTTCADNKFPQ